MGVFVWVFIPETKGVSLEKMDELFGVVQVVESKRNDPERGSVQVEDVGKRATSTEVENV
jgi:hypothetical protein